jgi:hypothetical protein
MAKIIIDSKSITDQELMFSVGKHKSPYIRVQSEIIIISTVAVKLLGLSKKDLVEFEIDTQTKSIVIRKSKGVNGFKSVEHPTPKRKYHRIISKQLAEFLREKYKKGPTTRFNIPLKRYNRKYYLKTYN